jgi:hypothetical protein
VDTRLVTRQPVVAPARVDIKPKALGTIAPETVVARPADGTEAKAGTAPATDKRFVASPSPPGFVYVVSDPSSGAVLMQLPSEQSLKLRAYREALERAKAERDSKSDVTA